MNDKEIMNSADDQPQAENLPLKPKTPVQIRNEDLKRLSMFRLLDDIFARAYFRRHPELAEFILRIITGFSDLVIDRAQYETQYDAKRLAGSRSLILDVMAGDTTGRKYDFEIENWNATPERGEVHLAAMVVENLHEGDDFSDLPETYVIFFSDGDAVGNGRAVNKFSFRNDDEYIKDDVSVPNPHQSMKGRTHILFVNGSYKDDKSDIGKLIHDFKCINANEMYFPNLAERARYLKENPKGVKEVSSIMDEALKEMADYTRWEERISVAVKMLQLGKVTHEDIATVTGLTLNEIKTLAGQVAS